MELPELTWGAASDRGLRQENQDSFLVAPPVFAVADGMGGHVGGAQASGQAVVRLEEIARGPAVTVEAIRAALEQADKDILAMGEHVDPQSRPGTTIAGVALVDVDDRAHWAVFHVGDSRIYRSADGGLQRVSSDHSVVQALVDAGAISEERALTHPQRHMITKALGFGDRGQPDVALLPVEPGQRFLMCSDGLTGELSDSRIAQACFGGGRPAGRRGDRARGAGQRHRGRGARQWGRRRRVERVGRIRHDAFRHRSTGRRPAGGVNPGRQAESASVGSRGRRARQLGQTSQAPGSASQRGLSRSRPLRTRRVWVITCAEQLGGHRGPAASVDTRNGPIQPDICG